MLANIGSSASSQVGVSINTGPYYAERVADIYPRGTSSDPAWLTPLGNRLYFQASAPGMGAELWKYDPITGTATNVADIFSGDIGSTPEWLTTYGSDIYFAATDADFGRQVWRYRTATGSLERVVDLGNHPIGSDPKWLRFVGSVLYFSAEKDGDTELFAYDTGTGETRRVKDINAPGDSDPQYLYGQGNILYFTADDGIHGREMWRSDGTSAGTTMIKDIYQGAEGSDPSSFNQIGYMFVFSAEDGVYGRELWRSDGTLAGTKMIKDILTGREGSNPGWSNQLAYSTIFFPAESQDYGTELWQYDLKYGARLLADINEGEEGSDPAAIGSVGWEMFFGADDGRTGVELWKTEPPYTYAYQVSDINPKQEDANPKSLGVMGTTLFFTADDGVHGEEVWYSEFPHYRTFLLKDIRPGSQGSIPLYTYEEYTGTLANAARLGWTIYFTADDGATGVELWRISIGSLPRTGFAPNVKTTVSAQPADLEYQSYEQLMLEIPKLNQTLAIVGVPKDGDGWNLDWLGGDQVGYLSGTAFPTWTGNTGLSGHVYMSDGSPGPFVDLATLSWNDEIIIHAWGQEYIDRVRYRSEWVDPNDKNVLSHKDNAWLTLITCRGFDENSGLYRWRTVVQAVLVEVADE